MKKFLSLVMALALSVSLFTFNAGATDAAKTFTDSGKITYKDAVDVVSAAKIIDGYTDGSFAPQGTLTRGAAAKIICNMVLGPTTAAALGVDAKPFSDVAVDNVFAGYIAYCAKQGIINGYADGTFKPAGLVTGNQFMKMLLGALGYDGSIEGFTGNNWVVNVIKLAKNRSLDDGNDNFVGSKAMTREEACLYAFNTLKATMVEYTDNSTVTVGNITISNKSKASDMANTAKVESYKDDNLMQFCEKYFDKLKGVDATDDFGRPGTKWTYDGDKIGTYADDADKTMVINKSLTAQAILATNSDYFAYDTGDFASTIAVYVNGEKQTATTYAALTGLKLKAGDQVEVFENDNDKVETVAVIRYSTAKIDTVSSSLSSTYTKKGASYSITLKELNNDGTAIGTTYYDKYDGDSTKELAGFSADTYKADVVLAVAMKGNTVLDSHIATVNAGKVTAYDKGAKANVTVGGTAYPLHADVMTSSNTSIPNDSLTFNFNDSTYTAYTDKNGYVIGVAETESVKIEDVYYVTGIAKESGLYSDTYYAQAVSLKDGTVTDFKLKTSDEDTNKAFYGSGATTSSITGAASAGSVNSDVAGLYTFTKDGSKYTVERYTTDGSNDYTTSDSTYYVFPNGSTGSVPANWNPTTIADDLEKADTKMTVGSQKVYLNSSTNYIKVEDTGDDIDVKTVTGGTNVKQTNGTNATTAIAIATKSNNNYIASYVILVSKDFVNTSSDDMVFVASTSNKTTSYTDANGKTQTGYLADLYMLDGSGKVVKDATITKDSNSGVGYYTYVINDDKVYELDDHSYNAAAAAAKDTVFEGWNGTTATKNYAYDDETGYYREAILTGVYSNALSATKVANAAGTYYFTLDDVDFASNVIIADDRSSDDMDKDIYNSEVTSVAQLKAAVDKKEGSTQNQVTADVYYDNGKVVMVYVWGMTNSGSTGTPTSTVGTTVKGTKTTSAATLDAVKAEATGAYTMSATDAVIGGTVAQNIFFRFATTGDNQSAIFRIYNADGTEMYYENASFATAGGHVFYVQVIGTGLLNAGSGTMKTAPLTTGDYTWKITSGDTTLASGTFTIA